MRGSRLFAAGLAFAALTGCEPASGPDAPTGDDVAKAGAESGRTGPPPPDADANASLGSLGEDPPRPGDPPRFVGRWAAEPDLCERAAWRFTAAQLTTPAGSVCLFERVREAPGGYDIAARCTAEAPERDDELRLRFPESAGGMTFESASIADAGLVRCPPESGNGL